MAEDKTPKFGKILGQYKVKAVDPTKLPPGIDRAIAVGPYPEMFEDSTEIAANNRWTQKCGGGCGKKIVVRRDRHSLKNVMHMCFICALGELSPNNPGWPALKHSLEKMIETNPIQAKHFLIKLINMAGIAGVSQEHARERPWQ